MSDVEKPVSVTQLSMPVLLVVVAVISIVSATISGTASYFSVRADIDKIAFRLAALEGAKDEGTEIRLTVVERKLDDIASNAQVTDWNRWRARVDGLILANATSAAQNQGRIIGTEVDISKMQEDLRDMMRRLLDNDP